MIKTGVIARLLFEKHFGFIRPDEKGPDLFFHKEDFKGHWNDLTMDFNANDKIHVKYEEVNSAKGPRAANVKRFDWPND